MNQPFTRIAVTRPPADWFHGITRALFDLYRQALIDLGLTIFDVPIDAFLPPDVVRISSLLSDLRAFRPQLAIGLSHGVHALVCRLPAERDGWRPNIFTDILDIPLLCVWDHAPLEFADQLLTPHPANPAASMTGAQGTLRRILAHHRVIHWSRDSGQSRIMRDFGFLAPNRVIHEGSPTLPGFSPQTNALPGVGFIGHLYQDPPDYPHPGLAALAHQIQADPPPVWDALMGRISAMNPGLRQCLALDPDQSYFWRFAHQLIVHQAQTSLRLKMLSSPTVSITCYGNLRTDLPGVPLTLIPQPGGIPFGPPLAAALARHSITIDVLNPGFVNGYSHKPLLGFSSGGFMLINRKADFISAFGDAGDAVSYASPEDLRAKVDRFLSHPKLRLEIGDAIRERIQARYQLNDVLQRVLENAAQCIDPLPSIATPATPAPGKCVANLLSQLRVEPHSGASVAQTNLGAQVATGSKAWDHSIAIPIPRIVRTMHQPHLRIELQVQQGRVGLGARDETGEIVAEQLASPSLLPVVVIVELCEPGVSAVILRNTVDTPSRALLTEISLCDRENQRATFLGH